MTKNATRLDAAESVFYKRQLEHIEATVYSEKLTPRKSRQLIPTQGGIPDWANVYTWRETQGFGSAAWLAAQATSMPEVNVSGSETSRVIKPLGVQWSHDMFEIKRAAALGMPLDASKAIEGRRAIERMIDDTLALGAPAHGLEGILTLTGTTSFTPSTKGLGGLTWGTMAAQNATGDEMVGDLLGFVDKLYVANGETFDKFVICLPTAQYSYAASKRIGDGSDVTALQFAKMNSDHIEDIVSWNQCATAGGGGTDRMLGFVRSSEVVAGLVPMEFSVMAPERNGMLYRTQAVASCGGVVARYPSAVGYGDGI